jgi:ring-1,2-phenylacetyl-CoA epoxidase subunit PaaC
VQSSDARIAEIAEKSLKEVTYHLRRSGDLMVRLGDGTAESHAKTQAAIDELWPYSGEMFPTTRR